MPEAKVEGVLVFLVDLFKEGFPNKVALHAVFGPQGKRRGPLIKEYVFKSTDEPNHEQLVELSNTLVQLAQEECEVFGKPSNFGVFAYDLLRSSEPYGRKVFHLKPEGSWQLLAEERGETLYEDDAGGGGVSARLLLDILDGERRDKRWMMELLANIVTGTAQRDAERIHALEEQVDGSADKIVKYIAATEQMLSQAADRKARAERAEMINEVMRQGVDMLKNTLVPAVAVYLSKGKVGVVQRLREILDELSDEAKIALFGNPDQHGIFDPPQAELVLRIADGNEDPRRLVEFIQSIRAEQAQAIMERELLTAQQLQSLQTLAKAVHHVNEREEAEAENPT